MGVQPPVHLLPITINCIKTYIYVLALSLYLKRLLVGGYDAVYEIGRDFRNEGVSYKHNTEFTMLEFYKAYIDYEGVMDITERMFAYTAEQVTLAQQRIVYQGQELNFAPPWRRISIRDAVQSMSWASIIWIIQHNESLYAYLKERESCRWLESK